MSWDDPKTRRPQTQCCNRPNRCAREVHKSELFETYYPPRGDSRRLCCPPDRYMGTPDDVEGVCCPPGTVPLSQDGNSMVLLAGGGGGMCCDEEKMCAGKCCAKAMPSAPWTESTCCDGECVQLATDSSHCGACGRACPQGQRCEDSTCVPA
jgi:hypothetical protein